MPSPTEITVAQLSHLVVLPGAPVLADVRTEEEFKSGPQLIPTAYRHASIGVEVWCRRYAGQPIVVLCQSGGTLSRAIAARLHHEGLEAQTLEGCYDAWREFRQPLVRASKIPRRDDEGRTVWVTRARPKVVRVACPWLNRRFIDLSAVFLFVPPAEVAGVAEHAKAAPFDIEGTFWSDRGERTTFDVMVEEFGLHVEPLSRLARIVRGADTGKLELTPQSAGLLATCLGYSRMYRDDLAQLAAAMPQFDALYRWSRDAVNERHGGRVKLTFSFHILGTINMTSAIPMDLALFFVATLLGAVVAGVAGFAFGLIASAIWLHFIPPAQSAPLIAAFARRLR